MEESLQCSHNLPRHSRMWQASILVRALVHGWRHMGGAHMRVDGVAVALVSGLDSSGSPGTLSVPCAHSSHPAALVGPRELRSCSAYTIQLWPPADPSFEFCTARRWSSLCRTLVRWLAATTAGLYK